MGCYETIMVPCPKCGAEYGAQSKSGPCALDTYTLVDAPDDVIEDVNRHAPFVCESCGQSFCVDLVWPERPLRPRIQRKVVTCEPENPEWARSDHGRPQRAAELGDDPPAARGRP